MDGTQHDLQLLHALAYFYWKHGQHGRAAAIAYAALKLGKGDIKLICLLAITLLDLDQPAPSLTILDNVGSKGSDDLDCVIRSIRARALLRLGQFDRAREEFKAAHTNGASDLVD